MLIARDDVTVERRSDVIAPQHEMVLRSKATGRSTGRITKERHALACAGLIDGGSTGGKGADVNHG